MNLRNIVAIDSAPLEEGPHPLQRPPTQQLIFNMHLREEVGLTPIMKYFRTRLEQYGATWNSIQFMKEGVLDAFHTVYGKEGPKHGDGWFEIGSETSMEKIHQRLERCETLLENMLEKNVVDMRLFRTVEDVINVFDKFMDEYTRTYTSKRIKSFFEVIPACLQILEDILCLYKCIDGLEDGHKVWEVLNKSMNECLGILCDYTVFDDNEGYDIVCLLWINKYETDQFIRHRAILTRQELVKEEEALPEIGTNEQLPANESLQQYEEKPSNSLGGLECCVPPITTIGFSVKHTQINVDKKDKKRMKSLSCPRKRHWKWKMKQSGMLPVQNEGLLGLDVLMNDYRKSLVIPVLKDGFDKDFHSPNHRGFFEWVGDIFHESFSPTLVRFLVYSD